MERPEGGVRHDGLGGGRGLRAGVVVALVHDCIQAGVARLDPIDDRVDDLDRRHVTIADQACQLGGRGVREVVGQGHVVLPPPSGPWLASPAHARHADPVSFEP